jgi:hypothetical protein
MWIHTDRHTYIHTYIRTYIHTYIHTYIRLNIFTNIHPSIHPSIHTYIHIAHLTTQAQAHLLRHTHTYTYTHTRAVCMCRNWHEWWSKCMLNNWNATKGDQRKLKTRITYVALMEPPYPSSMGKSKGGKALVQTQREDTTLGSLPTCARSWGHPTTPSRWLVVWEGYPLKKDYTLGAFWESVWPQGTSNHRERR